MDRKTQRRRQTWKDYMREWVRRADFRGAPRELLEGEEKEFTPCIRTPAEREK